MIANTDPPKIKEDEQKNNFLSEPLVEEEGAKMRIDPHFVNK